MQRQKEVFDCTRKHEVECLVAHFQNAANAEIRAEKIAQCKSQKGNGF